MFYNKKICISYSTQYNKEVDSANFNGDIFFEVCKNSLNFLIECLEDKKDLDDKSFNIEYLSFNTKIRNAIHTQLLKYCKMHKIAVNNDDELMDSSLTKLYIYNVDLKKVKSCDKKTIIENIFLYIYCGIFAVKAYHKDDFNEYLIHNLRLYGIDQILNKLVDKVTYLERTQLTLMIISYLNWVIGLVNELTDNHFNIRMISIQTNAMNEAKEMSLEMNSDNNVIIKEIQEPFKLTFDKLKGLKEYFNSKIVGQPQVVDKLNEILIGEMYNLNKKGHRPIGVLFFVGPTGVGKTETVKELAKFLYGTERIHRFDMSEYKSEVAIQKLIGAPNGYVGYQEGGTLTNAMQRNPNTVVLFDEIEKADKTVFDLFLQMIDEGFVTSNKGVKSYFDNTIIVFTSNLGVSNLTSRMGFDNISTIVKENVQYFFDHTINRPELLGRIGTDNIVVFNLIDKKEDLFKILDIMFNTFKSEYSDANIELCFDREKVYEKIIEGLDLTKGARDVRNKFELFKKHLYAGFFMKELNPEDMKNMKITFNYDGKQVDITNIEKIK